MNRIIRTFAKKVLSVFGYASTWCSIRTKGFMCKKATIVLINTPTHGNIGDQAIAYSEVEFIRNIIKERNIFVINEDEWKYHKNAIRKLIGLKHTILIHGGGYIGTLWRNEAENAFEIMESFPQNKKILMPQTAYYNDEEKLRLDKKKFSEIHKLKVFARDEETYRIFVEDLGLESQNVFLVPDIVTTLKVRNGHTVRNNENVLWVMRNDHERSMDEKVAVKLKRCITESGKNIVATDMFQGGYVNAFSKVFLYRKLKEFSKAGFVVTDRLHGMYFSAITGTPCIALNNISGKVKGGHKWLKDYEEIRFASNVNEAEFMIIEFSESNIHPFDFSPFDNDFGSLIHAIKNS